MLARLDLETPKAANEDTVTTIRPNRKKRQALNADALGITAPDTVGLGTLAATELPPNAEGNREGNHRVLSFCQYGLALV